MAQQQGKIFGKLPNAVARDSAINAETLVVIAYRATFVGCYSLHENTIRSRPRSSSPDRGICRGLSRDVVRRALKNAQECGFLHRRQRRQRRANGQDEFGHVIELLELPDTANGYRHVEREWFDGSLHFKSMAAFLFIRAGVQEGRHVFFREVADRFGWSRHTAAKYIQPLVSKGLIDACELPRTEGRFAGTYYVDAAKARNAKTKKPATETTVDGDNGDIHTEDLSTSSLKDKPFENEAAPTSSTSPPPPSRTSKVVPPAARNGTTLDLGKLAKLAKADPKLLAWMEADEATNSLGAAVTPELLAVVYDVMSDGDLKERLASAAGQRVSIELLSPAAMFAVRFMAIAFAGTADGDPIALIRRVLDAVQKRIGDEPDVWLNSLALIGKRLAAEVHYGERDAGLYAGHRATSVGKVRADIISTIRDADRASAINPKLYKNTAGLAALIDEFGEALVVDMITLVLARCLIDGTRVNAWAYFAQAVMDEHLKQFGPHGDSSHAELELGPGEDIPF